MEDQPAAIQDYASMHGFIVVQSYCDLNRYLRKHTSKYFAISAV
jgi:hypothetical protein